MIKCKGLIDNILLNNYMQRIMRALFTAIVFFLFTTCGIPTFTFLASPIRNIIDSAELTFQHNTNNTSELFKGYNIYYKLYNSMSSTNLCVSDKNIIDAEPPVIGEQRLTAQRFTKIIVEDEVARTNPHITINNKSTAQSIMIRLGDSTAPINDSRRFSDITNAHSDVTYRIFRNITTGGGDTRYKGLDVSDDDYLTFDADINGIVDDIAETLSNRALYVAFYAIAFGVNEQFRYIYSEPEFIGYLSLFLDTQASADICNT